jgi:hypothetical protein
MKPFALLILGAIALLVPSPVAAQGAGCAVWSNAENRCLQAAPTAPQVGVQPLTPTMGNAAAAITGYEIVSSPFTIALKTRALQDSSVLERMKDAPFFVNISTPFTRVAVIAVEARRTFTAPVYPSLDTLNAGRVQVQVSPGSSMTTVDAIQNVVIKRRGQIIQPIQATVSPTVVQNSFGAKRTSAEGVFVFDFETFDPSKGPITLVMIGAGGNFEWEMTPDDLRQPAVGSERLGLTALAAAAGPVPRMNAC